MAVVEIYTRAQYINGCDIFGERIASIWFEYLVGPARHTMEVIDVRLGGPGSGYNVIPGIGGRDPGTKRAMLIGSPRTRAEALNEGPARASRWPGMRRRSKR